MLCIAKTHYKPDKSKCLLGYAGKKKAKCEKINTTEKVNHLLAARTVAETLKKSPNVPEDPETMGLALSLSSAHSS